MGTEIESGEPARGGTTGASNPFPPATFRERSWRDWILPLAGAGNVGLWAALLAAHAGWLMAGLAGLCSVVTLRAAWRAWRGRRVGVRVDDAGVHEIFADGQTVSHAWNSVSRLVSGASDRFTLETREGEVGLDGHVEGVRALAVLLRARLGEVTLSSSEDQPAPSAEEVAEWLEVSLENLPIVVEEPRILQFAQAFLGIAFLVLAIDDGVGHNWNHALLNALFGTCWLLIAQMKPTNKVEIGASGVTTIYHRRRYRHFPWNSLELEGDNIRGRYYDFPEVLSFTRARNRVNGLIRQVLEKRGPLPKEAFSLEAILSAAALSRARPPGEPAASDRALSRAAAVLEDAPPRLAQAVEVETAEEVVNMTTNGQD